MGIFSELFERRSLTSEAWFLEALGGKVTAAGVRVNETTAMQISAVWQCVSILAQNTGTLPLPVYEQAGRGKEKARRHPLWRILNRKANPWMTAATLRMAIMIHLALWQAAYLHIQRDGLGRVTALWPLLPDQTKPVTRGDKLFFETVLPDGAMRLLPADEVLYIPGLTLNGLEAIPTVRMAREVLGLLLAQNEYSGRYFSNGANPGGVLTSDKEINETQAQQLALQVAKQVKGLAKANELLVLGYGTKFSPIGVDPQKSQLLESRRFQIEEVARLFNMPPHKLGLMDKGGASYASVEQQQISFVTETLRPWLVMIEQAMNDALLTDREAETFVIEHKIEGLLRGDAKSRAEYYHYGRLDGWLSANDIRDLENMNPLPGDEGEMYLVPINMQPAKLALAAQSGDARKGGDSG